jgi:hypothetical protein
MIVLHLDSDETRRRLSGIVEMSRRPRSILQAAAIATQTVLQRHFTARDKQGNRLGGRRTHFWRGVRDSTVVTDVTDRYALITIGKQEFAQKVFGGPLTAKEKPDLTIPVSAEAHGRRVSMLKEAGIQVFRIRRKAKRDLLAEQLEGGGIKVHYVLVPKGDSIHQDPDPEAMPPRLDMDRAAVAAAQAQLNTEIAQS